MYMQNVDFHVLLTWNFWFQKDPGQMAPAAFKLLVVIFAICLVGAIIFWLLGRISKKDRIYIKLFKKIQSFLITLGLVGFVILFFFFEEAPYLSSRFWLLIWLVIAVFWLIKIIKFTVVDLPRRLTEQKKIESFKQYLPKKK
ncbi:MAG: hypothetical protein WC480_02580 [Patescibacteria group bacterium]